MDASNFIILFFNFSLYFLMTLIFNTFIYCIGYVYCTSDASNPTPVYVVQGGKAILQCGFESSRLTWCVYNGGLWDIVASSGDVIDSSKYSVSKNPLTGLYYRLHILNVVVSDLKKYKCDAVVNGVFQDFYLQLIFIGMCNYVLVIFKMGNILFFLLVVLKFLLKLDLLSWFKCLLFRVTPHYQTHCELPPLKLD
jgi:hypothetical protein